MKIFNWVHRRFNQKDEVGRDMKKAEFVKNDVTDRDTDTLALLEHVTLAGALDGWKDGLLTIGTLGFDPLKELGNFKQQKESFLEKEIDQEQEYYYNNYHDDEEDDDDDDDDDEGFFGDEDECDCEMDEGEMDPLVFKAFKHGCDSRFHENSNAMEGTVYDHTCTNNISSPKPNDQAGVNSEYEERKKRGERITLADLFSADSDMQKKSHDHRKDDQANISKKFAPDHYVKIKGISFSKKFIPRVKEDSRPIQKLHKLMTKMLKRKIHPDLQSKETQLGVLNKDGHGSTESVSLLHTQVIVA